MDQDDNEKMSLNLNGNGHLSEDSSEIDQNISNIENEENDEEIENCERNGFRNYDINTRKGEITVKVICLGDSAVGKSKLLERFLVNCYKSQQVSTFALTLYRYKTDIEGQNVVVDFWDTAGQERFNNLHPSYYHQAHACIMVFDANRKITYKNLPRWYAELRSFRPEIPCFLAANKIDVSKEITNLALAFPQKNNIPLYYVSASDGTNVVKLFLDAISSAVKYKKAPTDWADQILTELE